jgi:hypothetical protein
LNVAIVTSISPRGGSSIIDEIPTLPDDLIVLVVGPKANRLWTLERRIGKQIKQKH